MHQRMMLVFLLGISFVVVGADFNPCIGKKTCSECVALKSCKYIKSSENFICVSQKQLLSYKIEQLFSSKSACAYELEKRDNVGKLTYPQIRHSTVKETTTKATLPTQNSFASTSIPINAPSPTPSITFIPTKITPVNPSVILSSSPRPVQGYPNLFASSQPTNLHTTSTSPPIFRINFPQPTKPAPVNLTSERPNQEKHLFAPSPNLTAPDFFPLRDDFKSEKKDQITSVASPVALSLYNFSLPIPFSCNAEGMKNREDWQLWAKAEYYTCKSHEFITKLINVHTQPTSIISWNHESVAAPFQNTTCAFLKYYKKYCGRRF